MPFVFNLIKYPGSFLIPFLVPCGTNSFIFATRIWHLNWYQWWWWSLNYWHLVQIHCNEHCTFNIPEMNYNSALTPGVKLMNNMMVLMNLNLFNSFMLCYNFISQNWINSWKNHRSCNILYSLHWQKLQTGPTSNWSWWQCISQIYF